MKGDTSTAVNALNRRFMQDYPREAANQLETMAPAEVSALLASLPMPVIVPVWTYLTTDVAEILLGHLPDTVIRALLAELEPSACVNLLNRLEPETRERYLSLLNLQIAQELRNVMQYPQDSAGQIMDPRVVMFRGDMTAEKSLNRLRARRARTVHEIFLVDAEGCLSGRIPIQDLALADPDSHLQALARRVVATVMDVAPREEVVETLEQHKLPNLPVVDFSGRLVGVIHQSALVTALQEEVSLDIQTMVGASKDERALSNVTFAVGKRLPWLHINLLTAFLAAAVVGLFESTIAKFTALAVLLPVVAGQSGNAGAQALAVTMRGLALREISLRHWPKVVLKEVNVGLLNGVAIAVTTAAGVYVWSRSYGLALVIATAMIIAMIAAGFSGALIPITLSRLGQDPAQSSSIILTTVTDVVGFFAFLGIATLLAGML